MAIENDEIETVDALPVLALDVSRAGLAGELPELLRAELVELLEDAERYAAAAQAQNTTRAYASDWAQFDAWCERYDLSICRRRPRSLRCMPPRWPSEASRFPQRAAASARAHRQAGNLSPTSDPRVLTILKASPASAARRQTSKTALLRDPLLELIDRIDMAHSLGSCPRGQSSRSVAALAESASLVGDDGSAVEVQPVVHVEVEGAVGIDVGPEQRRERPSVCVGEPIGPLGFVEDVLE